MRVNLYAHMMRGKRMLLADDVRNTGKTFNAARRLSQRPAAPCSQPSKSDDRMEAIVDLGIPNYALVEYRAPENYREAECPMCAAGEPVTEF